MGGRRTSHAPRPFSAGVGGIAGRRVRPRCRRGSVADTHRPRRGNGQVRPDRRRDRREDGDGPFDAGLQIERTRLAWGRTGLAFVAAGALLLHSGQNDDAPLVAASGLLLVASGVVAYLLGRRRHLELRTAVRSGGAVTSSLSLRIVAACVTAAVLLGLAAATF
ncbi:MAG: DUF202 domain-containing protein [Streptosporangiales bacterium]|nr:DUF202 domain-containing protein [Streptosporangiales bacterium]